MYPKLEGNLVHCCASSLVNKTTASLPSDVCDQGLYKPQVVYPCSFLPAHSHPISHSLLFQVAFLPISDYYYNLFKLHM